MAKNYNELLESIVECANCEMMVEGTNWDASTRWREMKIRTRNATKAAKKMIKAGNGVGAVKELDKVLDDLEKFKDDLKNIPDDIGETACGDILELGSFILRGNLANVCTCFIGLPSAGAILVLLDDLIQTIGGIISTVKSNGVDMKVFNVYKMKLIGCTERAIRHINKLKMTVSKEVRDSVKVSNSSSSKDEETTNESVIMEIMESCEEGYITEEDRDELLGLIL